MISPLVSIIMNVCFFNCLQCTYSTYAFHARARSLTLCSVVMTVSRCCAAAAVAAATVTAPCYFFSPLFSRAATNQWRTVLFT